MIMLKQIRIHMFRYYKDKEISFVGSNDEICPFVLIAGGNGKGKTTIVDAIEWCFTGDVKHLREPFDLRVKGDKNAHNSLGLIRNKESKSTDDTWVEIVFVNGNVETIIKRSTKKDELDETNTSLEIKQGDFVIENEDAYKLIDNLLGAENKKIKDFFNKYYICNVHKAEGFRSNSRAKITHEFNDFTIEHSDAEVVLSNLKKIQRQLDDQMELLKKDKVNEQNINMLKEHQKTLKNNTNIKEYIQKKSYPDEHLNIDHLSVEMKRKQLDYLIAASYNSVIEMVQQIILLERKVKVKSEFELYSNDIQRAIKERIYDYKNLQLLEEKQKKLTEYYNLILQKSR